MFQLIFLFQISSQLCFALKVHQICQALLATTSINGLEKWRPFYAAKYIYTKDTIILKTIIEIIFLDFAMHIEEAQYTLHTIRRFGCLQEFSGISWVFLKCHWPRKATRNDIQVMYSNTFK